MLQLTPAWLKWLNGDSLWKVIRALKIYVSFSKVMRQWRTEKKTQLQFLAKFIFLFAGLSNPEIYNETPGIDFLIGTWSSNTSGCCCPENKKHERNIDNYHKISFWSSITHYLTHSIPCFPAFLFSKPEKDQDDRKHDTKGFLASPNAFWILFWQWVSLKFMWNSPYSSH